MAPAAQFSFKSEICETGSNQFVGRLRPFGLRDAFSEPPDRPASRLPQSWPPGRTHARATHAQPLGPHESFPATHTHTHTGHICGANAIGDPQEGGREDGPQVWRGGRPNFGRKSARESVQPASHDYFKPDALARLVNHQSNFPRAS